MVASPKVAPFLKWPGGKSQEIAAIAAAAPVLKGRYIDPFVGGGSVLLAVPDSVEGWANDAVVDLVDLYRAGAEERVSFRVAALGVACAWDDLGALDDLYSRLAGAFLVESNGLREIMQDEQRRDLERVLVPAGPGLIESFTARLTKDIPKKLARIRRIQSSLGRELSSHDLRSNVEGAVRSAFYMAIRSRYNSARLAGRRDDVRLADFFFLREFTYAAMFRFNSRGEFNVPYGGITYNRKSLADKVEALYATGMVARLRNTTWRSTDFEAFLHEAAPKHHDFVFADPPYDSDFSTYDNRSFGTKEQDRLNRVLEQMSAHVMVVIKDTPLIRRLYRADRWRLTASDKTYMWTIKSRNDRDAVHLTITNY